MVNDLYNRSLVNSGASRLTIPSTDHRALAPVPWRGRQVSRTHRYLSGAPQASDDIESLIRSNQRLFFYVDRNVVGAGPHRTFHALPFVWHHFRESEFGQEDTFLRIPRDFLGFGEGPRTRERDQSRARGREAGTDPRTMALVNHFPSTPTWFNPTVNSRDRIVDTICTHFSHSRIPPRFIALDDIRVSGPIQTVTNELNSQVWNQSNPEAAMRDYCSRNHVRSGVGLMAAFPLSLLIGLGIVVVVGTCFWAYRFYQRCRYPEPRPKRD